MTAELHSSPYKALLVGLGQIGMGYDLHLPRDRFVYSHARALAEHPSFQLVGGVDPSAKNGSIFNEIFGSQYYATLGDALTNAAPDVVVIAAPTQLHAELIDQVLARHRPRLILCEKPLAYDSSEAERIVQKCESHGVQLYVNYMRRSEPGAIEIKRRLVSNAIRGPVKGVVWYTKGFLHNASHMFNLLEFWLGGVAGSTLIERGRPCEHGDMEISARVQFANGVVVFLPTDHESFAHNVVELLATNGRLRYEYGGRSIYWEVAGPDPVFRGYISLSGKQEPIISDFDRFQWHVADEIAAAIEGREHNICSGADALVTLNHMIDTMR